MDLSPIKLLTRLSLCIVTLVSVVMAPNAARAAQSIRVLLSADVHRLDVQADGAVWLTDSSRDGRAIRSDARITAHGKGFLVNGARIAHERLTLRAGERGLTLLLVKSNDKLPSVLKPIKPVNDQRLAIPVSGLVHVVRKGKGFLVINQVDLEEYVKEAVR